MKWGKVLQEAVYHDYKDTNVGGWKYHPDGRMKHVKEENSLHILNFSVVKGSDGHKYIEASYLRRKSIHTPLDGNEEKDEIYINKRNADITYNTKKFKDIDKSFDSFQEFYDFMKQQYGAGNEWPHKLMKKFIDEGWMDIHRKQQHHSKGNRFINMLDTVRSEADRLEQAIKFMLRERGVSSLQHYVSVRKTPYNTKVHYGESIMSNVKRAYRDILASFAA